jgi:hypothetical protein
MRHYRMLARERLKMTNALTELTNKSDARYSDTPQLPASGMFEAVPCVTSEIFLCCIGLSFLNGPDPMIDQCGAY